MKAKALDSFSASEVGMAAEEVEPVATATRKGKPDAE